MKIFRKLQIFFGTYPTVVAKRKTFSERLGGQFDVIFEGVQNFPLEEVTEEYSINLHFWRVDPGKKFTPSELLNELRRQGLRPANQVELLAFVEQHLETIDKMGLRNVLAIGARGKVDGIEGILALHQNMVEGIAHGLNRRARILMWYVYDEETLFTDSIMDRFLVAKDRVA